jgi:hypothetical protein
MISKILSIASHQNNLWYKRLDHLLIEDWTSQLILPFGELFNADSTYDKHRLASS